MNPTIKKWLRPLAARILGRHYPAVVGGIRWRRVDLQQLQPRDQPLAGLDEPHLAAMIAATDPGHLDSLKPQRARGVRRRHNGTDTLLYANGSKTGFVVDGACDGIWRRCEGTQTLAEIDRQLGAPPGPEQRAILRETVLRLYQLNLVDFPEGSPYESSDRSRIDLRQITFYVINCKGATARRAFMEDQLQRLGLTYKFVTAVESDPPHAGLAQSNLKILRDPAIQVPFAILEDDCEFIDDFQHVFDVPTSADALYLGVSRFGIEEPGAFSWGRWDNVQFIRYSDDYLRPLNMLSAHAILYVSDRYRRNAIGALDVGLTREDFAYPSDISLATLQASHLVVTPADPICYQSAEHDGNYDATRFRPHDQMR